MAYTKFLIKAHPYKVLPQGRVRPVVGHGIAHSMVERFLSCPAAGSVGLSENLKPMGHGKQKASCSSMNKTPWWAISVLHRNKTNRMCLHRSL